MIYFDNAATTLRKPDSVIEAVAFAMTHFGSAGHGTNEASIAAAITVFQARERLATLFGAHSASCVSFTKNATEALNIAIEGLLQPGDHVITSAASHNSVLRPLYRAEQNGCTLSIAPLCKDGSLDYEAFERLFTDKTRLVVMTHASNVTGQIYDINRLAEITHTHDALFVVDAAQTAGLVPIDMQATGIDVLAFTGHKSLLGPQGIGGLCIGEGVEIAPLIVGGSGTHSFDKQHPSFMPEGLEAGTLNSHGIAGLLAGVDYINQQGMEKLREEIDKLVEVFHGELKALEGITVYGNSEDANCGIVAINVGELDSALVCDYLSTEHSIATRSGAHCAPLMHEALGTAERGVVRFSFSSFNTVNEVIVAIDALRELTNKEQVE